MTDDHKADPLDLDALAEVARKATPGPWEAEAPGEHFNPKYDTLRVMYPKWRESAENYDRYLIVDGSYAAEAGGFKAADAEHIATFDPPTVLALLAALKEAQADNARLTQLAEGRSKLGLLAVYMSDVMGDADMVAARDAYLADVWDEAITAVKSKVGDDGLIDQHRLIRLKNPYRSEAP